MKLEGVHSIEHLNICQYGKTQMNGKVKKIMKDGRSHCTLLLHPRKIVSLFCIFSFIFSLPSLLPRFSKTLTHNTHSLTDLNLSLQRLSLPSIPSPWLTRCEMQWVHWSSNLSLQSSSSKQTWNNHISIHGKLGVADSKGIKSQMKMWHVGKTASLWRSQEDNPCPTAPRRPWFSLLHNTALLFHFRVFLAHSCTIQLPTWVF